MKKRKEAPREVFMSNPVAQLLNLGLSDLDEPVQKLGVESLAVSLSGERIMLVGAEMSASAGRYMRIVVQDTSDNHTVQSHLVTLPPEGRTFSTTIYLDSRKEVVFVPGNQGRFGVYSVANNTFRFSEDRVSDYISLPTEEDGVLFEQAIAVEESVLVLGRYSMVQGDYLRRSFLYNPVVDRIQEVKELAIVSTTTGAYRAPVWTPTGLLLVTGKSESLRFHIWTGPIEGQIKSFTLQKLLANPRDSQLETALFLDGIVWYAPYLDATGQGPSYPLVWTGLDIRTLDIIQIVQPATLPFTTLSPSQIFQPCDKTVASLVPFSTPPQFVALLTGGPSTTASTLDVPDCLYVTPLCKLVVTGNGQMVPGGVSIKDSANVSAGSKGVTFSVEACTEIPEEVGDGPMSCVPLATDKTVYNSLKQVNDTVLDKGVVASSAIVAPDRILPQDNGGSRCQSNIESYALQSRITKTDVADYRTLLTRRAAFNRNIDPRTLLL